MQDLKKTYVLKGNDSVMSEGNFPVVLLLLLWFSPNPGMSAGFKFVEWILMTLEGF